MLPYVFLGYRVVDVTPPDDFAKSEAAYAKVERVCSVATCLNHRPDGWLDRWDWNRASCYETTTACWATIPDEDVRSYVVLAYRLALRRWNPRGEDRELVLDELLEPTLPPLPTSDVVQGFNPIGFDVAGFPRGGMDFDHSPLSCNGMASDFPVNRDCLLDTEEQAIAAAKSFNADPPEPGEYFVVEVLEQIKRP